MKQYKDLTAAQKVIALALMKAARPPLEGESDAEFLTRMGQEQIYKFSLELYLKKKAIESQLSNELS